MTADLVPGAVVTGSREPDVLRKMMMVSSAAHAAAIAALVTASWGLGPHHPVGPVPISVPGAPGPLWTDLMAPSGPEPKPQDMVEKVTRTAPRPAAQRPSSSSSEGGPSTPALPGMHALMADVAFCDPEYLGQMVALIHRNWRQHQSVGGKPIVRFLIQRDGTLSEIGLRQPSGYPGLDLEALRAVTLTRAIPPLPACYPHPHYAMNLTFEYIR